MNEQEWAERIANGYGRASLGAALTDPKDINYILDILGLTKNDLADDLGITRMTAVHLTTGHIKKWLVYRYAILKWVDLRLNDLSRDIENLEDRAVIRNAIRAIIYRDHGYEDVCRICDEIHHHRFKYGSIIAGVMIRNLLKLAYNPYTFSFFYKEAESNERTARTCH